MTFGEYLSPTRFPLTTRAGVTPREQVAFDKFDLAQLRELRDDGHAQTAEQQARLAELEKKATALPIMLAELGEADT